MPERPPDLAVTCRRLVGRTAVVTGAGGAVGLAVARRLAAEGARVVLADLDGAAGRAAARAVDGHFVATDVTDPYMVEALFDTAYETCGGVDIAFHGAGPALADDGEAALAAVRLCCRAALPYMRRHGRGSVINAAGLAARLGPGGGRIARTAAAEGVLALSRELGVRFAREGIRVNALSAGPVGPGDSPQLSARPAEDPGRVARQLERVPLGRFARAEEIAAAAAFLASDDSSFITAGELLVDGGVGAAFVTPDWSPPPLSP